MEMTPKSASLMTFLVPGAAHFALGRPVRAIVALLSTVGLFFVGWAVLQSRLWHFVLFEPFGFLQPLFDIVPLQLLPESPNLGATIVAGFLREPGSYGLERLMRMPVDGEHWALFLTGASGVLACLWAADAHWLAKGRPTAAKITPPMAAMASWILPGWGHALAGQKDKGMLVGGAVIVMFLLGLAFALGHGVDRQHFSAWWVAEIFFGGGMLVASLVTAPMRLTEIPAFLDLGVALCTVAGLMNVMVMTDAYSVAEERAPSVVPEGGQP